MLGLLKALSDQLNQMHDQSVSTSSFIHWEIEKIISLGITDEKFCQKKAGIKDKSSRFSETTNIPVHNGKNVLFTHKFQFEFSDHNKNGDATVEQAHIETRW